MDKIYFCKENWYIDGDDKVKCAQNISMVNILNLATTSTYM